MDLLIDLDIKSEPTTTHYPTPTPGGGIDDLLFGMSDISQPQNTNNTV